MASKYDVFYVIATKGEIKVTDIVKTLQKTREDYRTIFNQVIKLESEGYILREKTIRVIHSEKSKQLFNLISFCMNNGINYNIMFKKNMIEFIQKAATKEFFTRKDVRVHAQTFNLYVSALAKYGLLFVISRKPLRCKLLRHHFFIDMMRFFNKKIIFYIPKRHSFIEEIKKELKKYKKNIKINNMMVEKLEKKEEIGFIYTSLNLEGNPLTLPETHRLLEKELVPEERRLEDIQAVTNYKKAVDAMLMNTKRKIKLNLQLILKYHEIAMSHIEEAGKIRNQNVRIPLNPEFKTADWREIPIKIKKLFAAYDAFESRKKSLENIIAFAAFFHNELQRIHPFIDGNSRMARLLLIHILRSDGMPVLDLPLGYFDIYLDLTKRSKKRDDNLLRQVIEEIVFINLKKVNRVA